MDVEYFNSEKFAISGKIINSKIVVFAQALPWSPKVRLLNLENDEQDFKFYTNKDFLEAVPCGESRFIDRVQEVCQMASVYPA